MKYFDKEATDKEINESLEELKQSDDPKDRRIAEELENIMVLVREYESMLDSIKVNQN